MMNSKNSPLLRKKKIPLFELLGIAFFAYYYLLPSASLSLSFIIMLGLGMLYIAYTFFMCRLPRDVKSIIIKVAFVILLISIYYYLFTVTYTVSANVSDYELKRFISKFQQLFFMMLPLLFTYRMIRFGSQKQKLAMLIFCTVMIIFVFIQSVQELSVNDTASRVWGEFNDMSEKNVGTYNFVYAVAVSVPAVFAASFNAKNIIYKVSLLGYVAFGLVFLVMAQYTISLLIAVVLCFVGFFLAAKKKATKILILIFCPIFIAYVPSFIEWFAQGFVGGSMRIRLMEIANYFTGESIGYNLRGRLTLYTGTIQAFLKNPIIGSETLSFDGHATFLTVLSDIGIIGGIPFYWLYFSTRKRIDSILKDKISNRCFLLTFLSVILVGFLNPIHAALPLPMLAWFVVPLMLDIVIEKKGE